MKCNVCKKEIPNGSEFCSYCGSMQDVKLLCRFCGKELPPDSDYCQYCGNSISEPQVKTGRSSDAEAIAHKKTKKWIPILIAALVIIIATIVILVVRFNIIPKSKEISPQEPEEKEVYVVNPDYDGTSHGITVDSLDTASQQYQDFVSSSPDISVSEFKRDFETYLHKDAHISGYVIAKNETTITISDEIEYSSNTPTLKCNNKSDVIPEIGDYVDVFIMAVFAPSSDSIFDVYTIKIR